MASEHDLNPTWGPDDTAIIPSAVETVVRVVPTSSPPAPRYSRFRLLGRGSIGEVLLAYDSVLERDVAYKRLIRQGDRNASARFEREAQVTGKLNHPGVVPVHDRGVDELGRIFYTMKAIDGRSLAEALTQAPDRQARLALLDVLIDACDAMAAAHAAGVVHRDLKPANIMLGPFGETLVVDWGLARASAADEHIDHLAEPSTPEMTRAGTIMGTPLYMAPEQARGERVDVRADVWSLGAILYELLTGQAPHHGRGVGLVLKAAATSAAPAVHERAPDAPAELAAVAMRALAFRPDDRYQSAAELADELRRWRDGRRVRAYAYSSRDVARRLLTKYRSSIAVGASAVLIVLGALVWSLVATTRERDTAIAAERTANDALAELLAQSARQIVASDPITAEASAWRSLALNENPVARGVIVRNTLRWQTVDQWSAAAVPDCNQRTMVGEWLVCLTPSALHKWHAQTGEHSSDDLAARALFKLRDDSVLLGIDDGWFSYNLNSRQQHHISELDAYRAHQIHTAHASDAVWIMFSTSVIRLHRDQTALRDAVMSDGYTVTQLEPAYSGGAWVVSQRGTVIRLSDDLTTMDDPIAKAENVSSMAVSLAALTDGRVLVGRRDGFIHVYQPDGALAVSIALPDQHRNLQAMHVSDDGKRVLVRVGRNLIYLWDSDAQTWLGQLATGIDGATHAWLSADGQHAWLHDADALRAVHLPPATGDAHRTMSGIGALAASPVDAAFVWFDGKGNAGRAPPDRLSEPIALKPGVDHVPKDLLFLADGQHLVLAQPLRPQDGPIFEPHGTDVSLRVGARRIAWARPHDFLLALTYTSTILPMHITSDGSVTSADPLQLDTAHNNALDIAADPGRDVAYITTGRDQKILRVQPSTVTSLPAWDNRGYATLAIAVDARSGVVAVSDLDHVIHLLAPEDGNEVTFLRGHRDMVMSLAFSPDGSLLASASRDQTARIWSWPQGELVAELVGHDNWVSHCVFSHDGRYLATGSWDQTVRIWDLTRLRMPVSAAAGPSMTAR